MAGCASATDAGSGSAAKVLAADGVPAAPLGGRSGEECAPGGEAKAGNGTAATAASPNFG